MANVINGGLPPGGLPIAPGSAESRDSGAPKTIVSQDIENFSLDCSFATMGNAHAYHHVYAYASKVDAGVLVALSYNTNQWQSENGENYSAVALTDGEVLGELQAIVRKYDFAKNNGRSYYVNGLPQNFGGSVHISYASGETIDFSNNQSPIISADAASEAVDILKDRIENKAITTKDADDIVAVSYLRDTDEFNYEHVKLEGDSLFSEARYGEDENRLFTHGCKVPADSLDSIRKTAKAAAMLEWTGLFEYDWDMYKQSVEQIVLTLSDGTEVSIKEAMKKPGPASNVIFSIRMYLDDLYKENKDK